jgi:hypothetical protein
MINSQQDLSQLTKRQLDQLAWQLKGTPEVQPIYQEMSRCPKQFSVQPDDPDWEAKVTEMLTHAFSEAEDVT